MDNLIQQFPSFKQNCEYLKTHSLQFQSTASKNEIENLKQLVNQRLNSSAPPPPAAQNQIADQRNISAENILQTAAIQQVQTVATGANPVQIIEAPNANNNGINQIQSNVAGTDNRNAEATGTTNLA